MHRSRGRSGLLAAALALGLALTGLVLAADDREAREEPPYPHGEFSDECSLCHREDRWVPAVIGKDFRHTTRFPLVGAHTTAACRACHVSLEFRKAPSTCVDCHQDAHRGELGRDCARCHTPRSFIDRAEMRRAHRTTRFPLMGAHAIADCEACHKLQPQGALVWVGLDTRCEACHAAAGFPLATQRPPDHAEQGFALDCAQCHTTVAFSDVRINHDATGFPLTGAHRAVGCSACHGTPFNPDLDTACVSCHQDDYDQTDDPNHRQAGFPTDCNLCHTTTSFDEATFNHAATSFPLTGAHVGQSCSACHADGVYDGKSTACASCHQDDYDQATDPNHRQAGFSTDCTLCHTTTSFDGASYDHRNTDFPLTGAHVGLNCNACHADGVYNGKNTACVACHQADYDRTTDPNHRAGGFSNDCTLCHTTTAFIPSTFNHNTSDFPLTGAHVGLNCNACHADNVYNGKSTACSSCHQDDYDRTTDPNHRAAGFPTDCTLCHTTTTWDGADFDHATSDFPLTGAHVGLSCNACHADGVYDGKPTDCYSCHRPDYEATTDPNHVAANFSRDCTQCHTTATFSGARYTEHDARSFPIYSGEHRGKWDRCSDCHTVSNNYAQFSCFQCHSQSETDSEHRDVSGYRYDSNACYECHPRGEAD